ncbi:hypothetical protein HPHPH29_0702 [Helicobacter pylori Hp H-29]|nr:hypothetical protein HPHPH29_0702 [Helicobacter pylori Hp H-29]
MIIRNQKLRFSSFFGVFLIQSLDFFHFLELKRFLKSFHSLKSCLSVTLLAHFDKDQLIF